MSSLPLKFLRRLSPTGSVFAIPAVAAMSIQELYNQESPGPLSSTSNQLWELAQPAPNVAKVPYRLLLDLMLQKLGVSKAEYHLELSEDGEVRVTVCRLCVAAGRCQKMHSSESNRSHICLLDIKPHENLDILPDV